MSFSKICTAVFGVCVWLGYADVRRSTDIAIPIAAFARVLWQLGMTATLQRTSFSAHVLADLNRTGSAAGPMDLAGLEEPLGVVDLHLHLCRTSDRLHCLGSVFLGAEQRTFSELLNMAVFRILSATDLPIVQLLLASVVGWFCSGRQKSAQQNATATPSPSLE